MSFTDDDLKRFKERADRNDPTEDWLRALLSRLEAAEAALLKYEMVYDPRHVFGLKELYEAWRKAAGK